MPRLEDRRYGPDVERLRQVRAEDLGAERRVQFADGEGGIGR